MRLNRLALSIVVVGVVAGSARSQARACSCAPPPPPAAALEGSAAVFEGEVLEDSIAGVGSLRRMLTFRVLRAWKGVTAGATVAVTTPSSSAACGYDSAMATGTRVLVYAFSSGGNLSTNLCTRTTEIAGAADDLAALGPPLSEAAASTSPEADAGCERKADACADAQSSADAGSPTPDRPAGSGCAVSPTSTGYGRSVFGLTAIFLFGVTVAVRRRRADE